MIKVQKLCAEARHHIHVVFKACHSNTKRVATGVNKRRQNWAEDSLIPTLKRLTLQRRKLQLLTLQLLINKQMSFEMCRLYS